MDNTLRDLEQLCELISTERLRSMTGNDDKADASAG